MFVYRITSSVLLVTLFAAGLNAQAREVLWLPGLAATSGNGFSVSNGFEEQGYNMFQVFWGSDYQPQSEGVVGSAQTLTSRLINQNHRNVLAIGHDYGGIVIRQMAEQSNRISAAILVGTPNNGSSIIREATVSRGPGVESDIRRMINILEDFASARDNECAGCDVLNTMAEFLSGIEASSQAYIDVWPDSDVLRSLPPAPSVPTAVFWGNDTRPFPLSRLVGSSQLRSVGAEGGELIKCYDDVIRRDRSEILREYFSQEANAIFGVFGSIVSVVEGLVGVSAGSTAGFGVMSSLLELANNVRSGIEASREKDEALADLLECTLIHRTANVYWESLLNQNTVTVTTVPSNFNIFNYDDECLLRCDEDYEVGSISWERCGSGCSQSDPSWVLDRDGFVTVLSVITDRHDGLLTEQEQRLGNSEIPIPTYELRDVNHFQQQVWNLDGLVSPNTVLRQAYEDLFQGNAGPEFVINR